MLCAAKPFLLLSLITGGAGSEAVYVFLYSKKHAIVLDLVDKEPSCTTLSQSTTNEEGYNVVAVKRLHSTMIRNVGVTFEVEPFSAIYDEENLDKDKF